jgi:hypothetical protein
MLEPPPPCALVQITIRPTEIVKTLKERLGIGGDNHQHTAIAGTSQEGTAPDREEDDG